MSSTKKDRKIQSGSRKDNPNEAAGRFAQAIADALHRGFGGTHAAVKTVVNLTNANERAVKNWFMAKNGPTGRHLVDLIRTSDDVLETVLLMSGRQELITAKKFVDLKQILIKMLALIDELQPEPDIAVPTCIKCTEHHLEIALFTPIGESKRLAMVQCSACGTPVGVLDPATRLQLEALESKIGAIGKGLKRIEQVMTD